MDSKNIDNIEYIKICIHAIKARLKYSYDEIEYMKQAREEIEYNKIYSDCPLTLTFINGYIDQLEDEHNDLLDELPEEIDLDMITVKTPTNDDYYNESIIDKESERQWGIDPGIRKEFAGGGFESFKQFRRAEEMGLLKILMY